MNYSERQITLTRFVAFWRPEKANFSNPKKIAFSERQNNFDAICRILAPWKSEYSESERNRFFVAPKQHIKNIECYDALKKRIFRIRKKSLFHGTKTTLTGLLAFWRPKKSNFFRIGHVSLCRNVKRTWSDFRFATLGKPNFPNHKQISFSW